MSYANLNLNSLFVCNFMFVYLQLFMGGIILIIHVVTKPISSLTVG